MRVQNLSPDYVNLYETIIEKKKTLEVGCSKFENFIVDRLQQSLSQQNRKTSKSFKIPVNKIKKVKKQIKIKLFEDLSVPSHLTDFENLTIPFNDIHEQQLNTLRKKFSLLPQNKDHLISPNRQHISINNLENTRNPRPQTAKSETKLRLQLSLKPVMSARKFPQWLDQREDFLLLKKSKYFDLKYKIISVCEIDSFKRDDDQKKLVAFYLQKLSFFKLMPFNMLMEIGGRLTVKTFEMGEFVCKQGDYGDQLYVVYKGGLHVIINGVRKLTFAENAIVGRIALDKNVPRTATLEASESCYLLMLHRYDYQEILGNIMKIEREKWVHFIKSLQFFKHFEEFKIKKLCQELQGKFLSPFDNLYKAGDPVDNIYIVKNGLLMKKVVVDLEQSNRWPIAASKWYSKVYSKTIEVEIQYKPDSLIGYQDIVSVNQLAFRNETIDAKEDCFLLYISKTLFLEIFDSNDLACFQDHHHSTNPHSFEDFIQGIKKQKQLCKNKINLLEQAISSNITTSSKLESETVNQFYIYTKKSNKLSHIVLSAKNAFRKHVQQYKVLKSEKVLFKNNYQTGRIFESNQYQ